MDCLRSLLQIVVEEPTVLAERPILTEPLPDAESKEIEGIQKVHPFYLPWDGRKTYQGRSRTMIFILPHLSSPPRLIWSHPVNVFLNAHLGTSTGFR
jgi:hypothetical protein